MNAIPPDHLHAVALCEEAARMVLIGKGGYNPTLTGTLGGDVVAADVIPDLSDPTQTFPGQHLFEGAVLLRLAGADAIYLLVDTWVGSSEGLDPTMDPAAEECLLILATSPEICFACRRRYGRADDGTVTFRPHLEVSGIENDPGMLANTLISVWKEAGQMALDGIERTSRRNGINAVAAYADFLKHKRHHLAVRDR